MIYGSQQRSIRRRQVLVLCLCGRGGNMGFIRELLLLRGWPGGYSTRAAVKSRAIYRHVVYDRLVIDIGDMDAAKIIDGAVVEEPAIAPITTFESNAPVTEAVINAAIKADMRAPVSAVPGKDACVPTPITGCPQEANLGRFDPRSGHPKIAIGAVTPVTGRPQIARAGKGRLRIYGQSRGANSDTHADANLSGCRVWCHRKGNAQRHHHQH